MRIGASGRVVKISGLRPSSRSVPLQDSPDPFSQGLPGAMKSVVTPRRRSQERTALAVHAGPLSERREAGGPRCTQSAVRRARTSSARRRRATSLLRHSRVHASPMVSRRRARPSGVRSWTSLLGPLSGTVEIDETYEGGSPRHKQERRGPRRREDPTAKRLIVGMVERGGAVQAFVTPGTKSRTIQPLVDAHVLPASMVYTDEASRYGLLRRNGYPHSTATGTLWAAKASGARLAASLSALSPTPAPPSMPVVGLRHGYVGGERVPPSPSRQS